MAVHQRLDLHWIIAFCDPWVAGEDGRRSTSPSIPRLPHWNALFKGAVLRPCLKRTASSATGSCGRPRSPPVLYHPAHPRSRISRVSSDGQLWITWTTVNGTKARNSSLLTATQPGMPAGEVAGGFVTAVRPIALDYANRPGALPCQHAASNPAKTFCSPKPSRMVNNKYCSTDFGNSPGSSVTPTGSAAESHRCENGRLRRNPKPMTALPTSMDVADPIFASRANRVFPASRGARRRSQQSKPGRRDQPTSHCGPAPKPALTGAPELRARLDDVFRRGERWPKNPRDRFSQACPRIRRRTQLQRPAAWTGDRSPRGLPSTVRRLSPRTDDRAFDHFNQQPLGLASGSGRRPPSSRHGAKTVRPALGTASRSGPEGAGGPSTAPPHRRRTRRRPVALGYWAGLLQPLRSGVCHGPRFGVIIGPVGKRTPASTHAAGPLDGPSEALRPKSRTS